jgi:hypothetical protein
MGEARLQTKMNLKQQQNIRIPNATRLNTVTVTGIHASSHSEGPWYCYGGQSKRVLYLWSTANTCH